MTALMNAYVPISEETLIDLGLIEPSPEYLARQAELDAWRRSWRGRVWALRRRVAAALEFHLVHGPLPRGDDD